MRDDLPLRPILLLSAGLIALLFLLPLLRLSRQPAQAAAERTPPASEPADTEIVQPAAGTWDRDTVLRVLTESGVEEMTLEAYLTGVVRAEMPASFAPEALKAQAAAARTYTLYKILTGGNHGDAADICTDSTCCQAYIDEASARANWGAQAEEYLQKTAQAVTATDGQAILYGGVPILAVFHAASAGLTRAAGEVWQSDLPYLQPASSPEDGAQIPNYYSRVEFTAASLQERLRSAVPEASLTGPLSDWLRDPVVDGAGSVSTLSVGGVTVRGSALRSALGLRSACFEWEAQGDTMVFFVTGYGHGVGLSQYGANEMAESGADWREILTHYYTGVTVGPYSIPAE